LAGILRKKALPAKKLDEIKIKANILAAFVETKAQEIKSHDREEL
jgi:protein disulfide-isomerase A6